VRRDASANRELGNHGLRVIRVPLFVGIDEDESKGPSSLGTSSCASARRASMSGSHRHPGSSARPRGAARSMSTVVSFPPVFDRAQAIQMPDRPVEVPISRAACSALDDQIVAATGRPTRGRSCRASRSDARRETLSRAIEPVRPPAPWPLTEAQRGANAAMTRTLQPAVHDDLLRTSRA